jgi:hypothetical protein
MIAGLRQNCLTRLPIDSALRSIIGNIAILCRMICGHMEADLLSLRDLIETRAANDGMSLRALWSKALEAIMRDELAPVLPDGVSLDTPFDFGGRRITWRQVITSALDRIVDYIPSESTWAKSLMFDGAAFNNWIEQNRIKRPRLRLPRRRPSVLRVREVVVRYCENEKKDGRSTSIPRMWKYVKEHLPRATRDQAIDALRAIEGSKERGRPRTATTKRSQ